LLGAGADPNTMMPEGDTALMTAARTGHVGAVKALLRRGALVNARESWKGQTALMWAAAANNAATVVALIEAGADIQARTKSQPAGDEKSRYRKRWTEAPHRDWRDALLGRCTDAGPAVYATAGRVRRQSVASQQHRRYAAARCIGARH